MLEFSDLYTLALSYHTNLHFTFDWFLLVMKTWVKTNQRNKIIWKISVFRCAQLCRSLLDRSLQSDILICCFYGLHDHDTDYCL